MLYFVCKMVVKVIHSLLSKSFKFALIEIHHFLIAFTVVSPKIVPIDVTISVCTFTCRTQEILKKFL
jgi:hypothetical protein